MIRELFYKNRLLITFNIILIILMSIIEAYKAYVFKIIIDSATGNIKYTIGSLVLIVTIFLLVTFIVSVSSITIKNKLINRFSIGIKTKINNSIINYKGDIATEGLLTNDVRLIEDQYFNSLITIIQYTVLFITSIYLLLKINVILTISIFIFGWLPMFFPSLFAGINQKMKLNQSTTLSIYIKSINEVLSGLNVIRNHNLKDVFANKLNKLMLDSESSRLKSQNCDGAIETTSELFGNLIFYINILLSGYLVMKGDITVGSMIAAVQLMNYTVDPLIYISKMVNRVKSVKSIIDKIENYCIAVESDNSGKSKLTSPIDVKLINATVSIDNKDILSNINLNIEHGKKYLILGNSGSGKSSLLKLIVGDLNCSSGNILYSGFSLSEVDTDSLYENISIAEQDAYIFSTTLKDNVSLFDSNFDLERFRFALEKSDSYEVFCEEIESINNLQEIDSSTLSGGEKQRIALARIFYSNANLLLLDEVTSALNLTKAYQIESSLLELSETMINVSHRANEELVHKYDQIIIIEQGQIVMQGSLKNQSTNSAFMDCLNMYIKISKVNNYAV